MGCEAEEVLRASLCLAVPKYSSRSVHPTIQGGRNQQEDREESTNAFDLLAEASLTKREHTVQRLPLDLL